MKLAHIITAGSVATGLMILPWVSWPHSMTLPSEFTMDHPAYGVLVAVALDVDRVCRKGDVAGIERCTTGAFRAEMARRLQGTGKEISAKTLRETRALVGDLRQEDLRLARAGGDRAVLVFRQRGFGAWARDFHLGVVFAWDGYRFLLHRIASRLLMPGDSEADGARQLVAELLESPGSRR